MNFQESNLEDDYSSSTICRDDRCDRAGTHACCQAEYTAICRDDRCDRIGLHAPHQINDTKRRQRRRKRMLGWIYDPLEECSARERKRREVYEPAHILESCVISAISKVTPKSMGMILSDLRHTYGECNERRLHRCLKRLSEKRRVVKVDLSQFQGGATLHAYLQPGTSLMRDPAFCFEQLTDHFESSAANR